MCGSGERLAPSGVSPAEDVITILTPTISEPYLTTPFAGSLCPFLPFLI